tara:strand:- start:428 stop:2719 length:2292 start_codon:yes stop_codon:yes gene_type:complete
MAGENVVDKNDDLAGVVPGFNDAVSAAAGYPQGHQPLQDLDWNAPRVYPSSPINELGAPSPSAISHVFVYNFYTNNEYRDDSGTSFQTPVGVTTDEGWYKLPTGNGDAPLYPVAPGESLDYGLIRAIVPRWIELTWEPVSFQVNGTYLTQPAGSSSTEVTYNNSGEQYSMGGSQSAEDEIRAALLNGTIVDEVTISASPINSSPYVSIVLQDANLGLSTHKLIDQLDQWRGIAAVSGKVPTKIQSLDILRENNIYSGDVTDETSFAYALQAGGFASADEGAFYVDESGLQKKGSFMGSTNDSIPFDRTGIRCLINSKFVGDVIRRSAGNFFGPFYDGFSEDKNIAKDIQDTARLNIGSQNHFSEDDYNVLMGTHLILEDRSKQSSGEKEQLQEIPTQMSITDIVCQGYILEKWEAGWDAGGTMVMERKDPIVVGGSNVSSALDLKIKVGTHYVYRPRAVYKVKFNIIDETTSHAYETSLWFLSKPGPSAIAETMNAAVDKPPPPPQDMRFIWNYDDELLTIHWSHPAEWQRDVKFFKIYRRPSIYEAYQLIGFYDFNDAIDPVYITGQQVNNSLVKATKQTYLRDIDFRKDSTYIYAIACTDAHGISSNLSEQFVVSWDHMLNKLRVDLISAPGAPEPYPNFYLRKNMSDRIGQTNLTSDLIKSSGRKHMYIALTPAGWRHPVGMIEFPNLQVKKPDGGIRNLNHILWTPESEGGSAPSSWKGGWTPPGRGIYTMTIANLDRHLMQTVKMMIDYNSLTDPSET